MARHEVSAGRVAQGNGMSREHRPLTRAEGLCSRQVINLEAIVEFDGVELLHVKLEHCGRRHPLRIEGTFPVFVMKAGGANADVADQA